jgi:uncharacterized protein
MRSGNGAGGKGPSVPVVLLCALVSGVALGIGFDDRLSGAARFDAIKDISLDLPKTWEELARNAPKILQPIHIGELPRWFPNAGKLAPKKPADDGKPVIAVVVEDLGADPAAARQAAALPAGVTLSFSPNPDGAAALSREARAAGHQIMVHLQMQPMGRTRLEPMALYPYLAPGEIARRVEWAVQRVPGAEGANNHLGGRFTASRNALRPVMNALAANRMFFLDSRTTQMSQAEVVARDTDVLAGSRDVYLDSETEAGDVGHQLERAEALALATGSAIVIGHPHAKTLAALKSWNQALENKGITLVPVTRVLERRRRAARSPLISAMFN